MHQKIKKGDLLAWVNECHDDLFKDGWEVFSWHNKDYNAVKIRRKYKDDQFKINEDGYEYRSLFPSWAKTVDYLFLIKRGYIYENPV